MTGYVTDIVEQKECKEAWEAAGVTCVFQNAGEEGNSVSRLIKRFARFTYVADMMPGFFKRAATPDDIADAKKAGLRCMYLSTNGVPLPQQLNSMEHGLEYIRVFFQLGCRMMHLTYNRRNVIGDGCGEEGNAGLSDFGRRVVVEMNRVGVIADVSHSGQKTSQEAATISEKPIVASHSTCSAVHGHIRGKPDEVIKAIADSGGYIGLTCIPAFLGGNGDISSLLDHIDYAAKKFGAGHVAIGTDAGHVSSNEKRMTAKAPTKPKTRARFEALWPHGPAGREWRRERQIKSLAWTNWPLFTVGLVQRGYSDEDIQKIIGGNALRVAKRVWPFHVD